MKPEKLKELSNDKFYVKKNKTFKEKVGQLCNFYIVDITVYSKIDKKLSFDITLKNDENLTETCHFPISYLHDPVSWLYLGFDSRDFYIKSTKKVFESSMNEIINIICPLKKIKTYEINYGWDYEDKSRKNELVSHRFFEFYDWENPRATINTDKIKETPNILLEYMNFFDINIAAPLTCFMLLSLLTSLRIFGSDVKPKFNMALVGGTDETRRKIALFYASLYKRDPSFESNEYELFHINKKDTTAEMRLKAALAKDCVLIAFEPDRRHLNTLLKEIYKTNVLNDENDAPNLLLYTSERFAESHNDNILVVQLNDTHNAHVFEEKFNIKRVKNIDSISPDTIISVDDDRLKNNIYYYIKLLRKKLNKNQHYVQDKFKNYKEKYQEEKPPLVTENAWSAYTLLRFSFDMYSKFFPVDDDIRTEVYKSLNAIVINSLSNEKKIKQPDIEHAKDVCKQIDCYFSQKKSKSLIGEIGVERNPSEKSVWYDDETIYITLPRAIEFLKLTESKLKFGVADRKALADEGFIKTYIKKDGKPEYTIHLQKALEAKSKRKDDDKDSEKSTKTRNRYIAFKRDVCRNYNLFQNIEEIILGRCQIDVKQEKNKDNEEE